MKVIPSSTVLSSWRLLLLLAFMASSGHALPPRVPNTTLRLPAGPPRSGFTTAPAFGSLTFTNPVAVVATPGETNRVFIVEQRGTIAVITNLVAPTRTTFLNILSRVSGGVPNDEQGLLGMAFHPGYTSNGHFYVYYTRSTITTNLDGSVNNGRHQQVSRFRVQPGNPHAADASSELRMLTMWDEAGNHNGGCLQFGPDGYLYVSTGDEGNQNDSLNNSQRLDKDFWAGLLRLDVDLRPGNLLPTPHAAHRVQDWGGQVHYRVPADNPFVGATTFNGAAINTNVLRAEFWAVGLRNPWRFSFDPLDGTLYCGDVGGSAWEEINVILRGGNYGWAFTEGNAAGPKSSQAPPGFTFVRPIVAYAHGSATNQGNSVSGGVMYRGDRFPSLNGKYIFADYVSGNIWAARPSGTNAVPFEWLTRDTSVAGFGWDPRNGDVLLCDQSEDTIKRLVTAGTITGPTNLSDTGAFTDLAQLTPASGVVPYEVNLPFWSDNGQKRRWFSIPNTNLAVGFSAEGNWSFPTGTVWIKHFDLELTNGSPASARRLETRFLVRYTGGVYGLTYRWGNSTTNAALVPEEGMDETFTVYDGGVPRAQTWHYPGRGECLACHTEAGGGALSFHTFQVNRDVPLTNGIVNQVQCLSDAGYFSNRVAGVNLLRAFAHSTNESASLEWRARSYLDANCAFCHQPAGTIDSWDARLRTPTALANLLGGLLSNDGGNPSNRVIAPGSTNLSMIHRRMSTRGPGAMPPIASALVDTNGAALLARWINTEATNFITFPDWQTRYFGSTNAPDASPEANPDADLAVNALEFLLRTPPLEPGDSWLLRIMRAQDTIHLHLRQPAGRLVEVQFSPDLAPGSWQPLDTPANRPHYPLNDEERIIEDTPADASRFYRARLAEL